MVSTNSVHIVDYRYMYIHIHVQGSSHKKNIELYYCDEAAWGGFDVS